MHLFTMATAHVAIIWLKQKRKVSQLVNFKLQVLSYYVSSRMIPLSILETHGQSPHVRWEENPTV